MTANLNVPIAPQPSQAAPTVTAAPADDGELQRLRSELISARAESERLRVERIQAEAEGFVTAAVAGEKAFPAEREAILAMYVQAATDDAKLGDGGNRVGLLTALYNARPASALTREQLNPAALQILRQHEPQPKGEQAPTDDEVSKLIGLTAFGRSVLDAKNGSAKS